jgi:cytoskeletal protein RodZ
MEENVGADIPDFEFDNNKSAPKELYEDTDESHDEKKKKKFPWLLVVLAALVLVAAGLLIWLFFFRGFNPIASLLKPAAPVSRSLPVEPSAESPPAPQPVTTQTVQPAAETAQSAAPAAQPAPQPEAPVQQVTAPVVQSATAPAVQMPPPVIQSPAQAPATAATANRQRPPAPVASYNVPAVIPKEGVPYKLRYGDTLWAIADAFYRNPWLYSRIARFNNIRNPDLIISGTTIIVPPKN